MEKLLRCMNTIRSVILLLSGGLDSVTLAYDLKQQGFLIHALLFNYGQVHIKELKCARFHCDCLNLKHTEVDLYKVRGLFSKSALTDGEGSVVVPNRNSVFVHIAASIAVAAAYESVVIGCNNDDARQFRDCTLDWLDSINKTLDIAHIPVDLFAPYMNLTKREVYSRSKELGIDLNSVWWCYKDGHRPCGKCLSCKKMKGLINV